MSFLNEYWSERISKSQSKLTEKNIRQVERQLRIYYRQTALKVIEEFEATYNKLLTTIETGKEPTPADLYKLDKFWQLQSQLRQELNKLGEKEIVALTKQFEI